MIKLDDLRLVSYAIPATKRATTGVSATVDMTDCHEIMVIHAHGKDTNSSNVLLRHATSTNTFASATAFGTAVAGALATSACQAFVIRNQPSIKRYLIIKQSTLAASLAIGVVSLSFYNRAVPPSSTLGAFTSLTRPTV